MIMSRLCTLQAADLVKINDDGVKAAARLVGVKLIAYFHCVPTFFSDYREAPSRVLHPADVADAPLTRVPTRAL